MLFAPLTWLAGPQISFVTILTLNLAGSAVAWYFFLSVPWSAAGLAAAVGGLFCGFAPGFVAHANGHLNFTAGWIAPVVVWRVLKLREPGRWLRNGAVLGVLLAVCFTIAAEALFFTALATGVFLATWSLARANRAEARVAAAHRAPGASGDRGVRRRTARVPALHALRRAPDASSERGSTSGTTSRT